jgi:hypothetical protein
MATLTTVPHKNQLIGASSTLESHPHSCTLKNGHAQIVGVSSLPVDLRATPAGQSAGAKHPAHIHVNIGGLCASVARVSNALGIPCTVIAAQHPSLIPMCKSFFTSKGITPLLIARENETAALSLIVPDSAPNKTELWVQRNQPLSAHDLHEPTVKALAAATFVAIGPIHEINPSSLDLYDYVCKKAQFSVVVPHGNLLRNVTAFSEVFHLHAPSKVSATRAVAGSSFCVSLPAS